MTSTFTTEPRTPPAAPTSPYEKVLAVALVGVLLACALLFYEVERVPQAVIGQSSANRQKNRAIACATLRADASQSAAVAQQLAVIEARWGRCEDEPGGR